MYLTVMGIMDSKHRHFGIFWTVIGQLACFCNDYIMKLLLCFVVSLYMYAYVWLYFILYVCVLWQGRGAQPTV